VIFEKWICPWAQQKSKESRLKQRKQANEPTKKHQQLVYNNL